MGQRLGLRSGLWSLFRTPVLLWEAVRAAFAMRGRGQIFPSAHYLAWRMHTAYGDDVVAVRSEDLATFLRWRRVMRSLS